MTEKNLENMTQKERIAYWDRVRKEEEQDREDRIRQLTEEQRDVLVKMHKELSSVLLTGIVRISGCLMWASWKDCSVTCTASSSSYPKRTRTDSVCTTQTGCWQRRMTTNVCRSTCMLGTQRVP